MVNNVYRGRFHTFFHVICWGATLTVICYWIFIYSLNQDVGIIDYKHYYDQPTDVFPVLSICLRNPFSATEFRNKHQDLNETMYLSFLQGKYFSAGYMQIDYNDIRLNMSDYIESYLIEWRNGSESVYEYATKPIKIFDPSFAGFWFLPGSPTFYNCYALQTPHDYDMTLFAILIRNTIFPSSIKSENYDMLTFLHYPNQLLVSYKTIKYWFASRDLNSSYSMRFQIRGIEVVHRRNKNGRPCNEEWNNYDHNIIRQHLDNVGCRPPYLGNDTSKVPLCNNKEQMARSLMRIRSDYGSPPPCRSMEKVYYTYSAGDITKTLWGNPGTFWVNLQIFDPQFKEIFQTR